MKNFRVNCVLTANYICYVTNIWKNKTIVANSFHKCIANFPKNKFLKNCNI